MHVISLLLLFRHETPQICSNLKQVHKGVFRVRYRGMKWRAQTRVSHFPSEIPGEPPCFSIVYKLGLILLVRPQGLRTPFVFHL